MQSEHRDGDYIQTLALYAGVAMALSAFWFHLYSGDHGTGLPFTGITGHEYRAFSAPSDICVTPSSGLSLLALEQGCNHQSFPTTYRNKVQ